MAFVKNALFMVGQGGIVRVFGFLTTAALSRILGPGDFGLYSLVASTASSVYGFVRLGTDASLTVFAAHVHESGEARQQKGRMLGAGLVLLLISALGGALVCLAFAAVIADSIFKQPDLQPWIAAAATFVVLQCLSQFLYCTVVGFQCFPQYAKVMAANAALGLAVTVPAALAYGPAGAVLGLATTQVFALAMLYRVVREALLAERIRVRFADFGKEANKLLRYGFPFYLSGLAIIPGVYFAQGLLAQHGGMAALGGLRVVSALVTLVSFVPSAIAPVILHRFSSAASGSREGFLSASHQLLKYSWIFAVMVGMLAAVLAPFLIDTIFGEQYAQFIPAALLAVFSSMFTTLLGVVSNAAFSTGRVMLILQYTVLQTLVFTAAAVLMVPSYGLEAYYLAEILGQFAIVIFLFFSFGAIREQIVRQGWLIPALLVSVLYAAVVAAMAAGDGMTRPLIGFVGLSFSCPLIYHYVLDRDERSSLALLATRIFLGNKQ